MKKKNYFSKIKEMGKACLLLVALSTTSFMFADVTSGLKLHYTFDNVSGGMVPDVSGNALDGTLYGAAVDVPGYDGSAISLPTVADYIQLPVGITGSLTDFTVATWVNVNALATWARIFDFGASTNDYMFLTASYGSGIRFAFKNNSGTTSGEQSINGSVLPTGKWVHVAVTVAYTSGVGLGTLYVNGVPVATNDAITITPAMLDATTLAPTPTNYIGKSQWPDPGLNGMLDDFRIYSRALTSDDILELTGTPAELISQWRALDIAGDLTKVTSNLTLATGTNGVSIKWASTNNAYCDTLGNVTRPAKFDQVVILTATASMTVGTKTYTLTKTFTITVTAPIVVAESVAKWNFISANIAINNGVTTVKDEFDSAYVATVMNDAKIKTIGASGSKQFNVLDLGNGTGYLDMGTAIGEQIYSLNNYTMSAYFRIAADYTDLNTNGNFIWSFANSADVANDKNGYIIGSLKNQSQNCTSGRYDSGDQYIGKGANAPKASAKASDKIGWHNICYVQNGTAGTVYLDGAVLVTGTMTFPPSIQLPKPGFTGTPFNWLGRSCYASDAYLKKTLLYGFELYRIPLTMDDINNVLKVPTVIDDLNNAYAQDSDYKSPALANEQAALTLGDLSAVTSNLTLPTAGTLDPTISIVWKSTHPTVISTTGVVNRQDYYDFNVVLTAMLSKNGQAVTKDFNATVKVKDGTQFANDLLVKYDFAPANVSNDSIVTDAAEKHFTGTVKKDARIKVMGSTTKFNVLALGDSIGYFDMGSKMGEILPHLNNYTYGAYYRVDADYTLLNNNGNMLFCFSNSTNSGTDANAYLYVGLKNQNSCITPTHWQNETQVSMAANALMGGWHHIAYTQNDTIGSIYLDGFLAKTGTMKEFPSAALLKPGFIGTPYNWIGRSCYVGDTYLRKTLVSDFRLYSRALTENEIGTSLMNVTNTIAALDAAYAEGFSEVKTIKDSPYKVISSVGKIEITGLTGSEKISLFDISGRQIRFDRPSEISVNAGAYVVKINDFNTKVIVR
ncbi:MAG: LamG domain-containing protein [Paludibacter sp.]